MLNNLVSLLVLLLFITPAVAVEEERALIWGSAYDLHPTNVINPLSQEQLLLGFLSYDPLFRYNSQGVLAPHLVKSWDIISDTHYRFHLHPGVQFHSGNPLTAEDVVWTYQQLLSYVVKNSAYSAVEKIVQVDELSFDVFTHQAFPELFHRLSYFFPVDSQWAKGEHNNDGLVVSGSGPFVLKDYQESIVWEFTANPNYWKKVSGNVDRIQFIPIQNIDARIAGLFLKDLDVVDHLLPEQLNMVEKNPYLKVVPSNGIDWLALQINMSHPALANSMVREALLLAINNEMLAESFGPLASAATQLSVEGLPGHNPELKPRYNPLLAHQLLHQAGYEQGLALKLVVEKDQPQLQRVVELLLSMLERVNIGVQIEALDHDEYKQATLDCRGDLVLIAQHSYDQNILGVVRSMLRPWGWEEAPHEGACAYYHGEKAAELLKAAEFESDGLKRNRLIQQLELQMYQDTAFVPLFWQKRIWAINEQRLSTQGWNPYAAFPYFDQLRLRH